MKNITDEHMRGMKSCIVNKFMNMKESKAFQSFHNRKKQYYNILSKLYVCKFIIFDVHFFIDYFTY